jgi:hypothetical protein
MSIRPRSTDWPDDKFAITDFHFNLVLESTLLDHGLGHTDSTAIADLDKGCLHNYNVITSTREVKWPKRTGSGRFLHTNPVP